MNTVVFDVDCHASCPVSEHPARELSVTEAEAIIQSVIKGLRREENLDSPTVNYTVEDTPAVAIKSWDMRVGLPILLIASIISASLVYGILFVLPRIV
jgi:hypothetical protein